MNFLEIKKLLFEAYMEYADLEDPLEKAKMESDIHQFVEAIEHHYEFEEETSNSLDQHKLLGLLFDAYDKYRQLNDPLERAKYRREFHELLDEAQKVL